MKKLLTISFILIFISGFGQLNPVSVGPAPIKQTKINNHSHTQYRFNNLPAYALDIYNYDTINVLVNFDPGEPSAVDTLMGFQFEEFISSMEQVNGFADQFYFIGQTPELYIANTSTGNIELVGEIVFDEPEQFGELITGMAFNAITENYYIIDTEGALWHLDPITLNATYINNTGVEVPIALAFDGSGVLYTYDIVSDYLFSIDKTTGNSTLIGSIGFDANYAQGMDYDPVTNTMYMAAINSIPLQAELRSVDLSTGHTTFLGIIGPLGEFVQYSSLVFLKDVTPPVYPPFDLSATVNENDILLNWTIESEFDGFNIYRDGVKINGVPVPDTFYLDPNLLPAIYSYEVTTVLDTLESVPATVEAEVLPFHMGGTIFIDEAPIDEAVPIDEAFAYAYQMEGTDIIDIMSYYADTLGYYSFYPVAMADYLIKAEPTFNSAYVNHYFPTYYGDVLSWAEATLLTLNDNIYHADINLIQINLNNNGNAQIGGYIYYGNDNGQELTPAANIQIMASKAMSDEFGMVISDAEGNFNFNNLDDGTYNIFAEIMGKEPEKAVIEVNNSGQLEYQVNLIILDETVVLSVEDDLPAIYEHVSNIYPNPSTENANIAIQSNEPVDLKIQVFGVTGQLFLQNEFEEVQNQILNIETSGLPDGQYQIRLIDQFGNIIIRRLLKF